MQQAHLSASQCPVARSLACVGEGWSILILRDAFHGLARFDEFQRSLGIAPNILARRLRHLQDAGLFERRLYSERPPRYEYLLTERGRDFFPVIATLLAWANRHLAPEGVALQLADRATGRPVEPLLVDGRHLTPLAAEAVMLLPGPAANETLHTRAARVRARPQH